MQGYHHLKTSLLTLALMMSAMVQATEDLTAVATEHYQQQQWPEAIEAYRQLLAGDPQNEQAWYRLAQSHISLQQGLQALQANQQLSEAQQIPIQLVWYQQAQAWQLTGDEQAQLKALDQAVRSGYSNTRELEENPLWSELRKHQLFSDILQSADKNLRPCMYDERYRQFDFWLGRWEVYGDSEKSGPLFGHNHITRAEQGCLIMEQWQGASGSTGTSMNYFDGIQNQWVQRWVSGGGTVIDYSGGLISKAEGQQAMQLTGRIYYAQNSQQPQVRHFRGTWTVLKSGVVRQFFEESTDGGENWYTWFDGYYFRENNGQKDE